MNWYMAKQYKISLFLDYSTSCEKADRWSGQSNTNVPKFKPSFVHYLLTLPL